MQPGASLFHRHIFFIANYSTPSRDSTKRFSIRTQGLGLHEEADEGRSTGSESSSEESDDEKSPRKGDNSDEDETKAVKAAMMKNLGKISLWMLFKIQ